MLKCIACLSLLFIFYAMPSVAEENGAASFAACIEQLKVSAQEQGLSTNTVALLDAVQWHEPVVKADRKQPEFTQSFADYVGKRVTDQRIEKGRELFEKYQPILKEITQQYGIPGQYLIAFWGLETNYGSYIGYLPLLNSLSTLACDQRRSHYFTQELINALKIVQNKGIAPEQLIGSWAGAMGYMQFMPHTYLHYAIDADGDGKADVWHSAKDALYSAANFLQGLGWQKELRWGREVMVPSRFDYRLAGLKQEKTLAQWNKLGVRMAVNGGQLPDLPVQASIIVPAGHTGPKFLVYSNFSTIMKWNRSLYYALAVGHLADRIVGAGHFIQAPPENSVQISKQTIEAIQQKLKAKDFYHGEIDGINGSGTRYAIRQFQQQKSVIADGFINPWLLKALDINL